jgi:hypothetical protein
MSDEISDCMFAKTAFMGVPKFSFVVNHPDCRHTDYMTIDKLVRHVLGCA